MSPAHFGSSTVSKTYTTEGNTVFKVLKVKPYQEHQVKPAYRDVLSFKSGMLVAVNFRGTLIPNITLRGGVVRLLEVQVGDRIYSRPSDICRALGVQHPMRPYRLE